MGFGGARLPNVLERFAGTSAFLIDVMRYRFALAEPRAAPKNLARWRPCSAKNLTSGLAGEIFELNLVLQGQKKVIKLALSQIKSGFHRTQEMCCWVAISR